MVINEIHYHPRERGPRLEFVEVLNTGSETVDLSGWRLEDAVDWIFPNNVSIKPNEFVLVAQDPDDLRAHYQVQALGPWEGKLNNSGETLTLRDAKGKKIDEVDYQEGFPWPTMAAGGGASLELVNPHLDNDLAGSWRSSLETSDSANQPPQLLVASQARDWHYFKGLSEPPKAWRTLAFDHQRWKQGRTPIGYADGDDHTVLQDMRNRYTTVYLRKIFHYDPSKPIEGPLLLRVYCDDGAVLWINEKEVGRLRVRGVHPTHRTLTTSNHEAAWEEIMIERPQLILRPGRNVIAILAVNGQRTSSDFSIDAELRTPPPGSLPPRPSPGERNRSFLKQPPPQIRQVEHEPLMPAPREVVTVSCKVTDPQGIKKVVLQCQRVAPGAYFHKQDSRYETEWETMPMKKDGDRYSVSLSAAWQQRRHLVRYRILAEDAQGAKVRVPYLDDEQPNFAYYCYDEAPAWTAADRPGRTPKKTFPKETMNALPILHLIADAQEVEFSQYHHNYNEQYLTGTLVAGKTVYDHIRFRNRGETTTYMVGKNKWRLNFNRTRELPAHQLDGRSKGRRWKRLNLNPCTMPYDVNFRGNASLNERLAFRLYQLAGSPAPDTTYIHFRVVDDTDEHGADQYSGDLWGLYMAFESNDGFLLDNHGEPDGELYRIKQSGNTVERPPAVPAPPGLSYREFWNDVRRRQSPDWWRRTVDLERYYGYHAISIITARYDQKLNHNHFLYRHPERGWTAIPWDADLSFRPALHDPYQLRWHPFLKNALEHRELNLQAKNRARELLDLLFTSDQVNALIDEMLRDLGPFEEGLSFAEVDHYLWNYHPNTTRSHRGRFYLGHVPPHRDGAEIRFDERTFAERVRYFREYLIPPDGRPRERGKLYRGWGYLQLAVHAKDADIPATPSIERVGGNEVLRFRCSAFADPQGPSTFAGMSWRIGEVHHPSVPNYEAGDVNRYEIEAVWQSPFLTDFANELTVPPGILDPGSTYRARVRFLDNSGRWSHWSPPIPFVAPKPNSKAYEEGLVISEIMYHPPRTDKGDPGAEFIEIANVGKKPLDLSRLEFSKGVTFSFTDSSIRTVAPGQRVVITGDRDAFVARYPDQAQALAGVWTSGKLSNKGEKIAVRLGKGKPFLEVRYDDEKPSTDGRGHSLVLDQSSTDPRRWVASKGEGGTPGL